MLNEAKILRPGPELRGQGQRAEVKASVLSSRPTYRIYHYWEITTTNVCV